MRSRTRSQLAAASRARDLCRAHPFTEAAHQKVVAELDEHVATAQRLAVEESLGRKTAAASVRGRQAKRREILADLKLVTRLGVRGEHLRPGLAEKLEPPRRNSSIAGFGIRTRAILTEIATNKELLTGVGLGEDLVGRLTAALEAYEAEVEAGEAGTSSHVTSAAQLRATTSKIVELIGVLDAANQIRFRGDAGLLAAWTRARNVVTAEPTPQPPGDPETPAPSSKAS